MTYTSADLIAVADDPDILRRLVALGRALGAQRSDIENAVPVIAAARRAGDVVRSGAPVNR